jgi:hypothetical protein
MNFYLFEFLVYALASFKFNPNSIPIYELNGPLNEFSRVYVIPRPHTPNITQKNTLGVVQRRGYRF